MLRKTLDPILEDMDNWFSHIEDHIINQPEVDKSALLVNWKLVEGLVNNVTKVTRAGIANESEANAGLGGQYH